MKIRNIVLTSTAVAALVALGAAATLSFGPGATDVHAQVAAPKADAVEAAAPGADPAMQPAALTDIGPDEHILGDPEAPNTIIEYASFTCPHCAQFHADTLPKLKAEWIEPGKAKLVFRHYPLDRLALRASLLANCFEGDRFFAMVDLLFAQQQQWATAERPMQHLAKLAGMAGLDRSTFQSCMQDEAMVDRILQRQMTARNEADITSTPSFLVNGEKVVGNQGYEAFVEHMDDPES